MTKFIFSTNCCLFHKFKILILSETRKFALSCWISAEFDRLVSLFISASFTVWLLLQRGSKNKLFQIVSGDLLCRNVFPCFSFDNRYRLLFRIVVRNVWEFQDLETDTSKLFLQQFKPLVSQHTSKLNVELLGFWFIMFSLLLHLNQFWSWQNQLLILLWRKIL